MLSLQTMLYVESEQHLLKCLAYIDMNTVLAGVVSHPSELPYGAYNEIQKPRRKCVLIDYDKLAQLTGFANYDDFRESHYNLVTESVVTDNNCRQAWWSESIAVDSDFFVENIKKNLELRAKGRKVKKIGEGFQLREAMQSYIADPRPPITAGIRYSRHNGKPPSKTSGAFQLLGSFRQYGC